MKINKEQEFDIIIEALRKDIEYYEKCLGTNKYFLGLANGENINLTFPRASIAHLLGVQIEKLTASGIVKMDTSSYEIVQKLINSDISYYKLKNSNFSMDNLFSEFIEDKLEMFSNILKIRTDDLLCVVKYYPDRTYINGVAAHNSDYFIIRRHEGNTYSALGIKRENPNSNRYFPVTSRVFKSKEMLDEFFNILKNQEVTYPHTFSIANYDKDYSVKIYSKFEEKLKWCRYSKGLSDRFGLIPVNYNDTIDTLDKLLNNLHDKEVNSSIIYSLIDMVKDGSIIDKKDIADQKSTTIPETLDLLIDAINDKVYSNTSVNVKPEQSYSELTNRIDELEKMNSELQQTIKEKNKEIKDSNLEISRLSQELQLSEESLNVYEQAHAKVLELRSQKNITR